MGKKIPVGYFKKKLEGKLPETLGSLLEVSSQIIKYVDSTNDYLVRFKLSPEVEGCLFFITTEATLNETTIVRYNDSEFIFIEVDPKDIPLIMALAVDLETLLNKPRVETIYYSPHENSLFVNDIRIKLSLAQKEIFDSMFREGVPVREEKNYTDIWEDQKKESINDKNKWKRRLRDVSRRINDKLKENGLPPIFLYRDDLLVMLSPYTKFIK